MSSKDFESAMDAFGNHSESTNLYIINSVSDGKALDCACKLLEVGKISRKMIQAKAGMIGYLNNFVCSEDVILNRNSFKNLDGKQGELQLDIWGRFNDNKMFSDS